jgi:hypothetical protein
MQRRRYHVLKEKNVKFADLEMYFVTWTKEKYSSIGAIYNLCADPELGAGRLVLQKIPRMILEKHLRGQLSRLQLSDQNPLPN